MSNSMMKGAMRSTKNLLYGYTEIQIKVRDATSNEKTGPTMAQMEFLSAMSHTPGMFNEMISIMDKRLNDHGKNWRHVYKTLVTLEYMICCGSALVLNYARDRLYMIETLKQFQHIDDKGFDQGGAVRNKSRDIVDLLSDEEMLAQARATKSIPQLRRRGSQEPLTLGPGQTSKQSITTQQRGHQQNLQNPDDDDPALAQALRESKELYEREQQQRRNSQASIEPDKVYPNFLDNVSRASLARSTESAGKKLDATTAAGTFSQQQTVDSLLDLSDEDLGGGVKTNGSGSQDLNALYSLNIGGGTVGAGNNIGHTAMDMNPFQQEYSTFHPEPSNKDPFAPAFTSATSGTKAFASMPAVPMPVQPGHAPVNHVSVGDNNIGAKPVMPHQVAPQFAHTTTSSAIQNQQQHTSGKRQEEDPFSQL